jgi:hypothetical protein
MTSLSFQKIESFILGNQFQIERVFTLRKDTRKDVVLIELTSLRNMNKVLVSVPSDCHFSGSITAPVFELSEIMASLSPNDDLQDFASITNTKMKENYDMSLHVPIPRDHTISMSRHLNDVYKKDIILKDIKEQDAIFIKDTYRQLDRLRYSIQGFSYKLGLLYSNYIGIINPDDTISIYKVDKIPEDKAKSLYLTVSLPIFYDKIELLQGDSQQIFSGIYQILNNNQHTHSVNIQRILEQRENIILHSDRIYKKKQELLELSDKFVRLLQDLSVAEQHTLQELDKLPEFETTNIHMEMKRANQRRVLQKKLEKIRKTQRQTMETLRDVKHKNEYITLSIDSILFDNIIMLDKIMSNFKELQHIRV